MRQETTALRDFDPAYDRFGGQTRTFGDVCSMSALPTISGHRPTKVNTSALCRLCCKTILGI
jgi:hypothetical protein